MLVKGGPANSQTTAGAVMQLYIASTFEGLIQTKIYLVRIIISSLTLHTWIHIDTKPPISPCKESVDNVPATFWALNIHYDEVIMDTMAYKITSLAIVYLTVYSGADQRKHQCSASLAFVRGIHRWPVNSLHKWPVTQKMFPLDDVIMFKMKWPHQQVYMCHWGIQWLCLSHIQPRAP